MKRKAKDAFKEEVRRAVADYMRSEGCSCCRNIESHKEHKTRLAELLDVPEYRDGSGYYNFGKFETREGR